MFLLQDQDGIGEHMKSKIKLFNFIKTEDQGKC